MSKKVQVMLYVTIMVVALSITAILIMMMPVCTNCGNKFCFGSCTIIYGDINGGQIAREDAPKTNQTTTRLCETERADESYFDNIKFIGDSRTVAMSFYGIKEENIFAENSLSHEQAMTKEVVWLNDDKLTTIAEAVMVTAPDTMIVNFGINGAAWMPTDTFMEGYTAFIDELLKASPHSVLVLEAIMPVSLAYEQRSDGISNEKIDELNDAIYELAKEKGLYYLATNEALKDDLNDLDALYNGDGLHYNAKAYEVIKEYMLTHAVYKK